MGKIKHLDQVTANSIAAGEVVERPASVIKELCENALDAGASIISIETLGGGVKRMQITDNGSGMDSEDALEAFERHATSKLSRIEDLDSISSMGFRGEALAAISAVSRITMTTKTAGAEHGTKVYIEGGELLEHLPCACPEGTRFIIEDLFFNTPARYKFLKKDSTETARISEIVERLALARPDVSFRLTHNGKNVLHSPGNNDLKSSIYAVFGKEIAEQSIFIESVKAEVGVPLQLEGAIGLPLCARRNRNMQYFYVNNRLIKAPVITKALDEAYRGTLMNGQFPFAVLKLSLPQNLIDINVHPQKMELRFWNEQAVFSAVYHLIKSALSEGLRHPDDGPPPLSVVVAVEQENTPLQAAQNEPGKAEALEPRYVAQSLPQTGDSALFRWNTASSAHDTNTSDLKEETQAYTVVDSTLPESMLDAIQQAKIAGQLFNTYIILERDSDYYLIDQHAAHEKILYEQLIQAYAKHERQSQVSLDALSMKLTALEMATVEEQKGFLESLGFEVDLFSENEIIIRAVPALLQHADPRTAFATALDQLTEGASHLGLESERRRIQQAFAMKACKAAVKAHDPLSEAEIRALIAQLLELENPYQCPHGRPVIVKKSLYELEKLFKRVI